MYFAVSRTQVKPCPCQVPAEAVKRVTEPSFIQQAFTEPIVCPTLMKIRRSATNVQVLAFGSSSVVGRYELPSSLPRTSTVRHNRVMSQ